MCVEELEQKLFEKLGIAKRKRCWCPFCGKEMTLYDGYWHCDDVCPIYTEEEMESKVQELYPDITDTKYLEICGYYANQDLEQIKVSLLSVLLEYPIPEKIIEIINK